MQHSRLGSRPARIRDHVRPVEGESTAALAGAVANTAAINRAYPATLPIKQTVIAREVAGRQTAIAGASEIAVHGFQEAHEIGNRVPRQEQQRPQKT